MALVGPVLEVACDLDALVGLRLLQRRVELGRLRGIDDGAEFGKLPLDVGGHAALLRGREPGGQEQQGKKKKCGKRALGHGASCRCVMRRHDVAAHVAGMPLPAQLAPWTR